MDIPDETAVDAEAPLAVHLLDVGMNMYGDSILCQFGDISVLVDGAHRSNIEDEVEVKEGKKIYHRAIHRQVAKLLGQEEAHVDLLIISHAHGDHFGCIPGMVREGLLTADWALVPDPHLGWGRAAEDPVDFDPSSFTKERILAAALREEPRHGEIDRERLEQFIEDSVNDERDYLEMLDTLEERGTKVVRYRGPEEEQSPGLRQLLKKFKDVGMRILGPSEEQLLRCAKLINGRSKIVEDSAAEVFKEVDDEDLVTAYLRMIEASDEMGTDAPSYKMGRAVNGQSMVIRFQVDEVKMLFTGDMQLADPKLGKEIDTLVEELVQTVKEDGPYQFVKVSHHGSHNGLSSELLEVLEGTEYFGICTGTQSPSHPSRKVLELLEEQEGRVHWARTDRNGRSTFTLEGGKLRLKPSRGSLDDPRPNPKKPKPKDEALIGRTEKPISAAPTSTITPQTGTSTTSAHDGFIEVVTRVPHTSTKVTVTIEVEPQGGGTPPRPFDAPARGQDEIKVAGGRALPRLLFITDQDALGRNIGTGECSRFLTALRISGQSLIDRLPRGASSFAEAARAYLRQDPQIEGVVLLGGYDVIPPQVLDCLPPALRDRVREVEEDDPRKKDTDDYFVWSDDHYGDRDGDDIPEVPVSRIPDGTYAPLIINAIQAGDPHRGGSRLGIRNVKRPFAEEIFTMVRGSGPLLVSKPMTHSDLPTETLSGDLIYLMLHGNRSDPSSFKGELTVNNRPAVTLRNIPAPCGPVVFTGCCWGALIVDTPANLASHNRPLGTRSPDQSIALKCLINGANAYIGCTGSHYSPLEAPYGYFGGPMHEAFWKHFQAGAAPALALYKAKIDYSKGMPHGMSDPDPQAIEFKILRQYTCLGLGW